MSYKPPRDWLSTCSKCEFGSCAPTRCYCGHEECSAFESYYNPYEQPFPPNIAELGGDKK